MKFGGAALSSFAFNGWTPPFVCEGVCVVPVTCKTGFGVARTGGITHRVAAAAAAFHHQGAARFAAKWVCGGKTCDAILLAASQAPGDFCGRCELNRFPVLYRCFDRGGRLLYIGSTAQRYHRMKAHESGSPWWAEVDQVSYVEFASITQARAAERVAIRTEAAIYNREGSR